MTVDQVHIRPSDAVHGRIRAALRVNNGQQPGTGRIHESGQQGLYHNSVLVVVASNLAPKHGAVTDCSDRVFIMPSALTRSILHNIYWLRSPVTLPGKQFAAFFTDNPIIVKSINSVTSVIQLGWFSFIQPGDNRCRISVSAKLRWRRWTGSHWLFVAPTYSRSGHGWITRLVTWASSAASHTAALLKRWRLNRNRVGMPTMPGNHPNQRSDTSSGFWRGEGFLLTSP